LKSAFLHIIRTYAMQNYLPVATVTTYNKGRYSIVTFVHCWTLKTQWLQNNALVDK